jgi:DNA-binding NarL/FixJ family response regulator
MRHPFFHPMSDHPDDDRAAVRLLLVEDEVGDAVLTGQLLLDAGGLDAVTRVRSAAPDVAIIALTGLDDPR